ncbi:MAG: nucleotidyltransferase family protein [Betaproteobacteria bacterium]
MTAILLAAGSASRFGSQKLLARLPDGRFVIEAAAHNLLAGAGRVTAVIGHDEALMRVLAACGCRVVVNARAQDGMGGSIAAGVRAEAGAAAWLIALGDMPGIRPDTIARVIGALDAEAGIVIPTYQHRRGHPVAFAARFGGELMTLQGDSGARSVVAAHPSHVKLLPVDDDGVLADIDTPDDLSRASPAQ